MTLFMKKNKCIFYGYIRQSNVQISGSGCVWHTSSMK